MVSRMCWNDLLPKYTSFDQLKVKMDIKDHILLKHFRLQMLKYMEKHEYRTFEETKKMLETTQMTGLFEPSFIH